MVSISLGGGIAMANINSVPAGKVHAFANFYGFTGPLICDGKAKFQPTIVFHNGIDPIARPAEQSKPLIVALTHVQIVHKPAGAP